MAPLIIDAHVHIYDILTGFGPKGEFRPLGKGKGIWANGKVEQFFPPQYGDLGFLAETLLELMDAGGIAHGVLMQGGNYGFHNHYAAETAKKYPSRFTAAVTTDPYIAGALDILRCFRENYGTRVLKFEMSRFWGLRGLHPELMPDSPVMGPLWSFAHSNRMSVVLDTGPLDDPEKEVISLLRCRDKYPDAAPVLAHLLFPCDDGKNGLRLRLLERLADAGWMFDITNYLCLWQKSPMSPEAIAYLQSVKQAVGTGRLLWGTDIPGVLRHTSYPEMTGVMADCGVFTPEELALVMGENAMRTYGISIS